MDTSDNQKAEPRIKTNNYLNEPYCKWFRFSIETLLEEIKPTVTEKHDNENRQKSTEKTPILGSVRILMQKTDDSNLIRILLSKCKVVDCDPHEGNQNCSYGGTPFR